MFWLFLSVLAFMIILVGAVALVTALLLMIKLAIQNRYEILENVKGFFFSVLDEMKRWRIKRRRKSSKYKLKKLRQELILTNLEIQFLETRVEELEKTQRLIICNPGEGETQIYTGRAWNGFDLANVDSSRRADI